MFSWCQNRLEITGKSVCLDVMQPWIAGTEKPLYRHAVRQAINCFSLAVPAYLSLSGPWTMRRIRC